MSKETRTRYRQSFWIVYGVIAAWSILGIAGVAVAFEVTDPFLATSNLPAIFFQELLLFVTAAIPIAVIVWYYAVDINSEGIWGYDSWGRYRFVPWASMNSVKAFHIPIGLRYLRVVRENERWSMWLPLFRSNMNDFETTIERWAPEDNMLRTFFRETKRRKAET